jgi:hypothetical protein
LELLPLDRIKCSPDGGSIGVTRIADFCQYLFDVQGDLSISSSYCRSDKHDALALGVRVEAVIHNLSSARTQVYFLPFSIISKFHQFPKASVVKLGATP